ncbi:MAG TPA: hypothetical protein VKW78_01345 [Terriglobales bacterium]|nr:hypothetical protein [Terriglobales bacterium]
MRLPTLLLASSLLIVSALPVVAADNGNTDPSAHGPQRIVPSLGHGRIITLDPNMFIPPSAMYRAPESARMGPGQEFGDGALCYTMHTLIVAEADKSGVTYPVGERTCTSASRFQTKTADEQK